MLSQLLFGVLRLAFGTVALVVIGLALLIQLGRLVLPQMSGLEDRLAFYLSEELQLDASVEQLEIAWRGLQPTVMIHGLRLSTEGSTVLEMGDALVRINLLTSATRWRPQFKDIELSHLHAVMQQDADGRWSLQGMQPLKDSTAFDLAPLQPVLQTNQVSVGDVSLAFHLNNGHESQLSLTSMTVQNRGDFHRLKASLDLPQQVQALRLVYERRSGEAGQPYRGQGFLQLQNFPVDQTTAFVSKAVAERPILAGSELSSRLWFDNLSGEEWQWQGEWRVTRPEVEAGAYPQELSSWVTGSWRREGHWFTDFRNLVGRWPQQDYQLPAFQISGDYREQTLDAYFPVAELDIWGQIAGKIPEMPELAGKIIDGVNPRGRVRDLRFHLPIQAPEKLSLTAQLDDVSVDGWRGAPAATHVSGNVQVTGLQGEVQFDNATSSTLAFKQLFERPFQLDSAVGRVRWDIRPASNQVIVEGNKLAASGPLGKVDGYFYLDAPLKRHSRLNELMLLLGAQDFNAVNASDVIPITLPDKLGAWLRGSFNEGQVNRGGVAIQGYFGPPEAASTASAISQPKVRSIELALDVDGASVDYAPGWPAITEGKGFVQVSAPAVNVSIDSANLAGMNIYGADLEIDDNPSGDGSLLRLKGRGDGPAASAWSLLTDTPLKDLVGDGFSRWQAEGQVSAADVELAIPLNKGAGGDAQHLEFTLKDARLSHEPTNLVIDDIAGDFVYDNETQLSAKAPTASLWGEPVALNISSERLSDVEGEGDQFVTVTNFSTRVSADALAKWSGRSEAHLMQGSSRVAGQLITKEKQVELVLRSAMDGLSVELPAPLGKPADETRELELHIPLAESGYEIHGSYGDQVWADIRVPTTGPVRGTLALGTPQEVTYDAFRVAGGMESLDVRALFQDLQAYNARTPVVTPPLESAAAETAKTAESGNRLQGILEDLEFGLIFNELYWGEQILPDVEVSGMTTRDGWNLRLDSDRIAGDIALHNDGQAQRIDLDYIRWPGEAESEPQIAENGLPESPLKGILDSIYPRQFVPVDINVEELTLGGKPYGQWTAKLRPENDLLVVQDIRGQIRGIRVEGGADAEGESSENRELLDSGALLRWYKTDDTELTRFNGSLSGRNLRSVSDAWQLPQFMETKSFLGDADLHWTGSPLGFDVTSVIGDFTVDVRNGSFLTASNQASSTLLRLIGLFNFDQWTRRLKFDFSDVYKDGLAFDRIDGTLKFDQGMAYLNEPIVVKSTSSTLQMGGRINIIDETLNTSLVATLPVAGNATLFTALAAGLPAAVGVYLVGKIFKDQVEKAASLSYDISGSWADPKIEFDSLFDNKAAEKASETSPHIPLDDAGNPIPDGQTEDKARDSDVPDPSLVPRSEVVPEPSIQAGDSVSTDKPVSDAEEGESAINATLPLTE